MKTLWTTIFFIVVSLAACSNMTGLWQLDWQSRSVAECVPDFLIISEDDQGNFTAAFNYTQATITANCGQDFTGNFSSNLTYNSSTSTNASIEMDSFYIPLPYNVSIQLSYDNSTDTLKMIYPGPILQLLYDRNGSYIPQNISIPFIGAVWTNITITNSTGGGCSCIPSSILITQSTLIVGQLEIQPTFNLSSCSGDVTVGTIPFPSSQLLQWTASGAVSDTTNIYIFDPYNFVNQLTVQIMNASVSEEPLCEYSAQRFTDFTPIGGTWYLDWQSESYDTTAPQSLQATPEDNGAYISTQLNYSYTSNSTGYLIGGFNNQYFDSETGIGFTYDEQKNTLLSFPTPRFPYSVLFSPNGSLINNTFVDSYWGSPVLANGKSIPTTCCVPNTIQLTIDSQTYLSAEYYFDQDYESNPACQSIAQDIADNLSFTELQINTPDINKLLWTDEYGSIISFANATTTSEITVQNFMNQAQCNFNMVVTSNPNSDSTPQDPLSANLMASEIAYFIIGLVMLLNWI